MLSLCDYTATMAAPWVDAGHRAVCVDVQHADNDIPYGNPWLLDWDIMDPRLDQLVIDNHVTFVAAFPPCTDLAVSGARWFREKGLRRRGEAITLVGRCLELAEMSQAPYCIENPVSILSTHWRPPDHVFDPYQYGGYPGGHDDGYTKKTCLWVGNGFVMPEPRPIPLDRLTADRIHKAPPGPARANFRSATPAGFAQAVYEANAPEVTADDVA